MATQVESTGKRPTSDEDLIRSIGIDAYLYFYPLVTMDVTRRQFTNGKAVDKGPMNTFVNIPTYPPVEMRSVVRPNFDTLYSVAWLDLTKEPVIVSVPDTKGRYYLLPMLDMWTDVFASLGSRTTGTRAAHFLVTPPGWNGSIPGGSGGNGLVPIKAPTPYVWIIGRTKTDGPQDFDEVHAIQNGFKLTPVSAWGKQAPSIAPKSDPSIDMRTSPKAQIDAMPADAYFAYASELLKVNAPHLTDEPIVERMKRIGLEPGKTFDMRAIDSTVRRVLEVVPREARQLMAWKVSSLARVVNGWSMNTDTMGVYGNYYLKRAIVTQLGLGANLPEDAIYPLNLVDSTGQPLHGVNRYTLHFDKGMTPPVNAFWSVTLYDAEGFQVANALNRFAVSSWMPFKYNSDGSLNLYFQHTSPGADKETNWLPAPPAPFNLTMRLYAPKSDALTGRWGPPPVVKR